MIKGEDGEVLRGQELVAAAHPWAEWSPRHTIDAAWEASELIRYLNLVTQTSEISEALPYPSQMDSTVGHLAEMVARFPQLYGQLAHRLKDWQEHPHFGTDDDPRGVVTAVRRAEAAVWALADAAELANQLYRCLGRVREQTHHLKMDPDRG